MQKVKLISTAVFAMALYSAATIAADSGVHLKTKALNQKVAINLSTGNPASVSVQAKGLANAGIKLQGQSNDCLMLLQQIANGVCVPSGPGGPVSPN